MIAVGYQTTPDILDEENGPYADLLDHLMSLSYAFTQAARKAGAPLPKGEARLPVGE